MALLRDSKGRFALSSEVNLDVDLIISLYKNGMTLESISKKFNCSIIPIITILNKNNIKRRQHYVSGNKHPCWKGGRFFHKAMGVYMRSVNGKKIPEHRYVWIQENQMPIPQGCIIHHKNGNKLDNRIENLVLLPENYHHSLHNVARIINNPEERYLGINRHLRTG